MIFRSGSDDLPVRCCAMPPAIDGELKLMCTLNSFNPLQLRMKIFLPLVNLIKNLL